MVGPVCVAIGVFDGVHCGHQAVIHRALDEAAAMGGTPVALTFDPHPTKVLRPGHAPRLLTSTPHKRRLIAALGCRRVLVVKFDAAFAAAAPEHFVAGLAGSCDLGAICVGRGWEFGRNRSGNVDLLCRMGAELGFRTVQVEPVSVDGVLVSSTRIRGLVEEGELDCAERLLGRRYAILGTVVHGSRLGRGLGFPTANLAAHNEQFPPNGVYAVRVVRGADVLAGVANVGIRPTTDDGHERRVEVHLLDFAGDLYGEDIEVAFVARVREERAFPGFDALRAQIVRDIASARGLLGSQGVAGPA
jgi:riboflavin kinase/FMN adenylyltransferase